MKTIKAAAYVGPNPLVPHSVLHMRVDLGALADLSTGRLGADFTDRLAVLLPGLGGDGEGEDFIARMKKGLPLAEVIARAAVELQRMAGFEVEFWQARPLDGGTTYDLLFAYDVVDVGFAAGELALYLVAGQLPGEWRAEADVKGPPDITRALDAFLQKARKLCLDPASAALVRAAKARDIPWRRVGGNSNDLRFGFGRHQKWVRLPLTSDTRAMGFTAAREKRVVFSRLQSLGLPVPRRSVAPDADTATNMADHMGFPLFMMPKDGPADKGLVLRRDYFGGVGAAFRQLCPDGGEAVIGNFMEGALHRLLVVGDCIVGAVRHQREVSRGSLDGLMKEIAKTPDGWSILDADSGIHDHNRSVALQSARALDLDLAGVDFLTPDLGQSYNSVGGRIVAVSPTPDLGFFLNAGVADIGEAVMDMLYPPGASSRIPIAAITGTNGKTTTCRMLAHILKTAGYVVGLSSTMGVYVDENLVEEGDRAGNSGAGMILNNPTVEAAVLETARGGLLKGGMGYDACDVSAVLNISNDHLGQDGVETVEDLAPIKRTVVTGAREAVIINADDPLCAPMLSHSKARQGVYFTVEPENPVVVDHIKAGRPAMVFEKDVDGGTIFFHQDGTRELFMKASDIPSTYDGRALFNVQNAMAAAAMAYYLGVSADHIRHGLGGFGTSYDQSGGRLNVYDGLPFQVILDYAHNPEGHRGFSAMLEKFPVEGRRIGILSLVGRNSDEVFYESGRIFAGVFDHYICRESDRIYDRPPGEAPKLLRDALIANGVPDEKIEIIVREQTAVEAALELARPGDQVVIFGHKIQRTWDQITSFVYKGNIRE